MGWDQPFHFQVDPLNLRPGWRLQRCGMSPATLEPVLLGKLIRESAETAPNAMGSGRGPFRTRASGQN